jgi:hypothetical protein
MELQVAITRRPGLQGELISQVFQRAPAQNGRGCVCANFIAHYVLTILWMLGTDGPFQQKRNVDPFRTFVTNAGRKQAMHVPCGRRTLG